jgi:tyrosyl-tRNA synthetase
MKERQFIAQITHEEELEGFLSEGVQSAYVGFDPTADSLHVGNFMQIMALRRWQQAGHRVVALVGGGTGKIGDPSGKTELRQMLDLPTMAHNIARIRGQLEHFLDLSSPEKGVIVDNADWLDQLAYIPFIRDIGRHFSVNRMLTAECFRQRLEKGLTFLEFNYMLLQSFDFLQLNATQNVSVQIGGDDQWSNMISGVDLVRRINRKRAFCITTPLLTTSDGRKMGKTEQGALWLDAAKTSPFDFFQYWRNVEDQAIRKCFLFLTDLSIDEIDAITSVSGAEINEAKVRLAFEIASLVHGIEEAAKAKAAAAALFGGGGSSGQEPAIFLDAKDCGESIEVLDLLVAAGVCGTKGEARRLIQQGGLSLDGKKVENMKHRVERHEIAGSDGLLIQKGRKHFYRLRFSR